MINRAITPYPCPRFFTILISLAIFTFIFTLIKNENGFADDSNGETSRLRYFSINQTIISKVNEYDLNEFNVKTHQGYVSMKHLNDKVFKAFGYEIEKPTLPVPTLRMIREPSCDVVFSEWLRISKEPQPEIPPKYIPSGRKSEFTMFGFAALSSWYMNDKNSAHGEKPRNWDRLSELMEFSKMKLASLAYGTASESMYHAMDSHPLTNMSGVVIGSMQPWVEVMALRHGAKHVLTVEYNKLNIQKEFQDRMDSIYPIEFVKNWQKYAGSFDFAASFSSIEHSGLGRYGDPLDPIGDLREMLKVKCILKKGGLLFLGFPIGTDALQYNAHRIYGSIRLALMLYGFEWIETFWGEEQNSINLNSERLHRLGVFGQTQYTLVLKKL